MSTSDNALQLFKMAHAEGRLTIAVIGCEPSSDAATVGCGFMAAQLRGTGSADIWAAESTDLHESPHTAARYDAPTGHGLSIHRGELYEAMAYVVLLSKLDAAKVAVEVAFGKSDGESETREITLQHGSVVPLWHIDLSPATTGGQPEYEYLPDSCRGYGLQYPSRRDMSRDHSTWYDLKWK